MKIGSLVHCINNSGLGTEDCLAIRLQKNVPYTIRNIFKSKKSGDILVHLEEVKNIMSDYGVEVAYNIGRFREIEFPPSIAEEIEECLTRELVDK